MERDKFVKIKRLLNFLRFKQGFELKRRTANCSVYKDAYRTS